MTDDRLNTGYVLGQLASALTTSQEHEDAATRERATKKVEAWTKVFQGMLSGALETGSRTPVKDAPAWATLEVVKGGFATGELLAGGALRPHEEELALRLGLPRERAALNAYYLGDRGMDELRALLKSRRYRVEVPEEGALLAVAALLGGGHADAAREVLEAIGPFLARLRFYPIPDERPRMPTSVVHVETVADALQALHKLRVRKTLLAQRETLSLWNPLQDRMVALFLETVSGPAPSVRTGPDGKPLRGEKGKWLLEGGWPCQSWPAGWVDRAKEVIADYDGLRSLHNASRRPERPAKSFGKLLQLLRAAVVPSRLDGRMVGEIRMVLALVAAKRGLPGSSRLRELREKQARVAALPTKVELAHVLAGRLGRFPAKDGLDEIESLLVPVNEAEAKGFKVATGASLERLRARLVRCVDAPLEEHVASGVIPSAEVLARVVPQLTSHHEAAGIANDDARILYSTIYAAFRQRRSLLLLDLAHQVTLHELPWVAGLELFRVRTDEAQSRNRRALEEVVLLALTSWPQTILPNKLLQEIGALQKGAGLDFPIVEEVAADIFMGTFTPKYQKAAQVAARRLGEKLYGKYYEIDARRVLALGEPEKTRWGASHAPEFAKLCSERAGPSTGRSVAANGKVIEQEQILTTHNLAVLVDALALEDMLVPRVPELARRAFSWIAGELARAKPVDGPVHLDRRVARAHWKSKLQAIKNSAYAWRQMVFFLSLVPRAVVDDHVAWARDHLAKHDAAFRERLEPYLEGLARAARGLSPEGRGSARLLGWTTEKHALLS